MASSSPEEVVEMEVDQLGRLPDEVVMLVINKLYHAKTLIRLSMAAKRYTSLVSKTHSLLTVMDYTIQGASTPTATPTIDSCPTFDEAISVITHRFQQVKHVHLHLRSDTPLCPVIPLGSGRFSQWVAVFGSQLEQIHFLAAASVLNPDGTRNAGNGSEEEESSDWEEYRLRIFRYAKETATGMHVWIGYLVQKCEMLESVVFPDNCSGGGGALFMAKPHLAKLKMFLIEQEQSEEDLPEFLFYKRTGV